VPSALTQSWDLGLTLIDEIADVSFARKMKRTKEWRDGESEKLLVTCEGAKEEMPNRAKNEFCLSVGAYPLCHVCKLDYRNIPGRMA